MYDPMVAKLIVWDVDREHATRRMIRALREFEIGGLKTLLPFHEAILQTDQWARAETCRDLIEDKQWLRSLAPAVKPASARRRRRRRRRGHGRAGLHRRGLGKTLRRDVIGPPVGGRQRRGRRRRGGGGEEGSETRACVRLGYGRAAVTRSPRRCRAPSSRSRVEKGATVEEGALVCVIEAMKMENEITAHKAGTVTEVPIAVGGSVANGDTLAVIVSASE